MTGYSNTAAPKKLKKGPVYVVEHLEEGLDEWCTLEYRHICKFLPADRILFTRWNSELDVKKLVGEGKPLPQITTKTLAEEVAEVTSEDANVSKGSALPSSFQRVCLLDMDAEEALQPDDVTKFDAVVFGGILGNIIENEDGSFGSDDRTSEIRPEYTVRRHLGPMQMTTDTAVLVTHMVLEEARPLAEIPFLDSPEIANEARDNTTAEDCVCMEGFRYVGRRAADGDWEPTLPDGMKELLARDADNDILGEL